MPKTRRSLRSNVDEVEADVITVSFLRMAAMMKSRYNSGPTRYNSIPKSGRVSMPTMLEVEPEVASKIQARARERGVLVDV